MPRAAKMRHKESRRFTILVVDDNRDAAETLSLALRYSGYEVVTTTLPQEVLGLLAQQPFDVAVLGRADELVVADVHRVPGVDEVPADFVDEFRDIAELLVHAGEPHV